MSHIPTKFHQYKRKECPFNQPTGMACTCTKETPEPTQEKPTILRCSDCGERHIPDEDCGAPEQKDFVEGKWDDEAIEELKEVYGDFLEGEFCCSGRECACGGVRIEDVVWRDIRKVLATAYAQGRLDGKTFERTMWEKGGAIERAYAQGEQNMLSRAKEAMPPENDGEPEDNFIWSQGYEHCRTEALSALEALTTKI